MGKGNKRQTVTTNVDPASQRYVNQMRQQAMGYANDIANGQYYAGPTEAFNQGLGHMQNLPGYAEQFFNPYQDQVIGGVQRDFDRQRQGALTMGAQEATKSGAFGGSRSGILQSELVGDVNQAEAAKLAELRYSGYADALRNAMQGAQGLIGAGEMQRQAMTQQNMNPLFGRMNAMQMLNMGMGPTGQMQSMTQHGGGNFLGGAAGGVLTGLGAGLTGGLPLFGAGLAGGIGSMWG